MKNLTFCTIVLALLGLSRSTITMAQGQDANFQWVGNEISTVIGNSNPDMNTVYLYNVGTGKYLNIGSYWGTCVSAYNVGIPITFLRNGSYYMMESLTYTPMGHRTKRIG